MNERDGMEALGEIERYFGIALPPSYRQLAQSGCMAVSDDVTYLWIYDAEWVPLNEVTSYEWPRDRIAPGLVPFAFTGGGAPWAWSTSVVTSPGEFEILLCNRDQELADVYAPSVAAWLYRLVLEWVVYADDELHNICSLLNVYRSCLARLGRSDWAEHLKEISVRDPVDHGPAYAFLTEAEVAEALRHSLGTRYRSEQCEFPNQAEWGWYDLD